MTHARFLVAPGAALVAALLAAAVPETARADAFASPPGWDVEYAFAIRNWKLVKRSEELTISEIRSPLSVSRRVNENGYVSLYLAGATVTSEGEVKQDVGGFQDARLAWKQFFDGDRWRLQAGIGLPTGKADIETGEEIVSGVVSNRILGMHVKRYGEGFNLFASGARAFALGEDVVASVGAGFEIKGRYDYQELNGETIEVTPGNETFFQAGLGGTSGDRVSWSADAGYRLFGADQRDGEDVYEEGDEVDLKAGVRYAFDPVQTFGVSGRIVIKGDGSEVGGIGRGSIDSLSLDRYLVQSLPGGMQRVAIDYEREMNEVVDILASAGLRRYSEYSFPGEEPASRLLGSARVWEAGVGTRFSPAPSLPVTLFLTYSNGNAEDGFIDISGFDFTLAFRWRR